MMQVPLALQMPLEIADRAITLLPQIGVVMRCVGDTLGLEDRPVDAHDQHLLVIRAVENPDLAALGQVARAAPEKIVFEFGGAGVLETEHLHPLRVHARHHVPDRAILAGGIHRLKDHQYGMAVRDVVQLLQGAQSLDMRGKHRGIVRFRRAQRRDPRRPLFQIDGLIMTDAVGLEVNFLAVLSGNPRLAMARQQATLSRRPR